MRYIDLIFFDLDGTLVDSKEGIVQAVNYALKQVGLKEKPVEEIAAFIGTGEEDLIRKSLGLAHQDLFEKARNLFGDYRRSFTDNVSLYPGVKEMLEYFKNKKKIIVTNRKHEFALLTLKALGIDKYFQDIIGGDDANCLKPSSCPLDKIIHRLKMTKKQAIMVGDMDIDVLTGKNAGILTCAVTYGIGKKEDILASSPDYVIDDIARLKELIN